MFLNYGFRGLNRFFLSSKLATSLQIILISVPIRSFSCKICESFSVKPV